MYIEEYSPNLQYIKGTENVVADALSRLDRNDKPLSDEKEDFFLAYALSRLDRTETPIDDTKESFLALMDCFAKESDASDYSPLNYQMLKVGQEKDKTIMRYLKDESKQYVLKEFHGGGKSTPLICFKDKIVIPGLLQKHVIMWYHTTLCHPGINRTEESIGQHLWWPKMRDHITNYVKICPLCQKNKRKQKKYGLLPAKEAETIPWDKLCVDLIGPYRIRRSGKKDLICRCVTMIDPATGWFEIHQYNDKFSITVANIVEQE